MSVKVVTLRTGAEVPEPVIRTVTITMSRLMETDPIALYEAVILAATEGDGMDLRLVSPYAAQEAGA